MIKPADLLEDYERAAGPVRFTLARIPASREGEFAAMMQAVIDGQREPITDEELGVSIPGDAEA